MASPKWNDLIGANEWPCGCMQFQDGYEFCNEHRAMGYAALYPLETASQRVVTLRCHECGANLAKVSKMVLYKDGAVGCFNGCNYN